MSDCEVDIDAITNDHCKPCPNSYSSEDSDSDDECCTHIKPLFVAIQEKQEEDDDGSDDKKSEDEEDGVANGIKVVRRKHSMAHDSIVAGNLIFLHVDLETGGEQVGVIQISCVCHDYKTNEVIGTFDSYVRPPASVKPSHWNEHATSITGLNWHSPEIKGADEIHIVWEQFKAFCEKHIGQSNIGCLVAWNGKGSDCKWLWKITEELYRGQLHMPDRCEFFMDPMGVIKHYKGCKLNVKHSGIIGMGLAKIFCYVTGNVAMEGEHNSLHDAQAQFTIVKDRRFRVYHIDKPKSVQLLEAVWADKRKRWKQGTRS
jgi:Inhibitor of the KinA pathway to sporulation, predicted exonuclease